MAEEEGAAEQAEGLASPVWESADTRAAHPQGGSGDGTVGEGAACAGVSSGPADAPEPEVMPGHGGRALHTAGGEAWGA